MPDINYSLPASQRNKPLMKDKGPLKPGAMSQPEKGKARSSGKKPPKKGKY